MLISRSYAISCYEPCQVGNEAALSRFKVCAIRKLWRSGLLYNYYFAPSKIVAQYFLFNSIVGSITGTIGKLGKALFNKKKK